MTKRPIKYVVEAMTWFDKVYGNTYHACRIHRTRDNARLYCPFTYGYGGQYHETALAAMADAKWLPPAYRAKNARHSYERENGYPILWIESRGTKGEAIGLGTNPNN
jgi:hypothetical protein